jgi:predicted dehydrogenase
MAKPDLMERVVNLCKRRGLVFPSSEIYGGFRSTWDYGPLGVLLKRNVKDAWWRSMVQLRDDVVGLDSAILMHPRVWEASGHVQAFTDPLVDCRNCKERFRADHLPESGACPNCGAKGSFTVSQISSGRKNRLSLELDGGQGAVAWCSEEGEMLWRGSRAEPARLVQRNPRMALRPELSRLPAGHAEGWSDALTNVIRGFYDQIRDPAEQRPWVATLADGAYTMRLIEAVLASSQSERWVTLEP